MIHWMRTLFLPTLIQGIYLRKCYLRLDCFCSCEGNLLRTDFTSARMKPFGHIPLAFQHCSDQLLLLLYVWELINMNNFIPLAEQYNSVHHYYSSMKSVKSDTLWQISCVLALAINNGLPNLYCMFYVPCPLITVLLIMTLFE